MTLRMRAGEGGLPVLRRVSGALALMFVLAALPLAAADLPAGSQSAAALTADEHKRYEEAQRLINSFSGDPQVFDDAYRILAELARKHPQSGYPYAGVAALKFMLATMGMRATFNEALALAQNAIRLDPNIADAHVTVARVMLEQNNVAGAQQASAKALAIAPDNPRAMFARAKVFEHLRNFGEAEKWYRAAIGAYSDNLRKSNVYNWLGELLKQRQPLNVASASEAFEKAVELDPRGPWKLNNAALFFMTYTQRYDHAVDYLNRALKILNASAIRRNLGLAHFYRWGDAYLNPDKYRNAGQRPLDPRAITAATGVTPEQAFVEDPFGSRTPAATIALLKTGIVKTVDVIPAGHHYPAIVAAAIGNHLDVIKLLVAHGANVNAQTNVKNTALFSAAYNGNLEIARFLVEKGARINVVNADRTPLLVFALNEQRRDDVAVLDFLLERGADPTLPDQFGHALLTNAVTRCHPRAVRLLVGKYRQNPDKTFIGEIPLVAAAAVNVPIDCKGVLEALLDSGASPWVKYVGRDVLHVLRAPQVDANVAARYRENAETIARARKSAPPPPQFGAAYPNG